MGSLPDLRGAKAEVNEGLCPKEGLGPRALPPTGCQGLSDLQPNASVLLCMGGFFWCRTCLMEVPSSLKETTGSALDRALDGYETTLKKMCVGMHMFVYYELHLCVGVRVCVYVYCTCIYMCLCAYVCTCQCM